MINWDFSRFFLQLHDMAEQWILPESLLHVANKEGQLLPDLL
jgi:hypothetical protein